jgi:anthranilate phosphoribosyltransferase
VTGVVARAIARAVDGEDLSADEMAEVAGAIMDGQATPAQIGALLVALRMKGETVDEVVGAARAMRARAAPFRAPDGVVVDTCGTGGDGRGTLNVSTIAAFVVAACGVRVAKHGNRALSSKAGSADLLEALGIAVSPGTAALEESLRDEGLAFLFAPDFHPATRHAAGARREIGVRTLFNLLGPLTNPAGVRRQVVGVYDGRKLELVGRALAELGAEHALVVHGAGGLDELAPDGETEVVEVRQGDVRRMVLAPEDFGLARIDAGGLAGDDAATNAARAREVLSGRERGAGRTSVVMTAAAALVVADAAPSLRAAAERAAEAIDGGAALALVERMARRGARV